MIRTPARPSRSVESRSEIATGTGVSEIHLALPPAQTEGKPMAGDPKEFRQRALRCTRLAKEAPGAETRQAFVDLAWRWDRLAAELENAQALLKTERDGA
jgi:hypothetical protein